jgi:hypothetical protein
VNDLVARRRSAAGPGAACTSLAAALPATAPAAFAATPVDATGDLNEIAAIDSPTCQHAAAVNNAEFAAPQTVSQADAAAGG